MVKTKNQKQVAKQGNNKKRSAPKRKSRSPIAQIERSRTNHALTVANLLNDPCGAPLPPPFLAGESGMVTRFVLDGTMIGVGNTCGYIAFHPNSGWTASNNAPNPGAAIVPSDFAINATNSPGFAFLAANASKVRGLAACVTVLPTSLSLTTITGEIAVSSVSPDALRSIIGTSHTVDQVAAYTNARTAIERRAYDTKFKPGSFDGKYASYVNTGAITGTGTDISDTNAILIALRGIPIGSTINVRFTWICEWVPKFNLGLTPSVSNKPVTVDHMAVGHSLDQHKPNWWHNLAHTAGDTIGAVAATVGKSAGIYMQSAATNFVADTVAGLALLV